MHCQRHRKEEAIFFPIWRGFGRSFASLYCQLYQSVHRHNRILYRVLRLSCWLGSFWTQQGMPSSFAGWKEFVGESMSTRSCHLKSLRRVNSLEMSLTRWVLSTSGLWQKLGWWPLLDPGLSPGSVLERTWMPSLFRSLFLSRNRTVFCWYYFFCSRFGDK